MTDDEYKDLGITPGEAALWQAMASIPESVFESYLEYCRREEIEMNEVGLLAFAQAAEGKGPKDE